MSDPGWERAEQTLRVCTVRSPASGQVSADAGAAGALSKSENSRVQNPGSVARTASQVLAPPARSVSVCVEWINPGRSEAGTAPKGS